MVQVNNSDVANGTQPVAHSASQLYDANKLKQYAIDVFCSGCKGDVTGLWELGSLVNAWKKVTGSRYMQFDTGRQLKPDAIILGDSIAANKGTALEGWYDSDLLLNLE